MKAIHEMRRMDRRKARAMQLVAAIMKEIDPLIDPRGETNMSRIYHALLDLLMQQGIEVLTDYDRQEMGLPPRGNDGWTAEEIVALEHRRLEVMLRPIAPVLISKDGIL